MNENWHIGNAVADGEETRGWILGHFIDPSKGVRHSGDVEVKWATHAKGEKRHEWTSDDQRTTLVMLIEGHFRVSLTEGVATFKERGDYALWGAGVDHTWEALEDSVVLTVRWPSSGAG